MSRPNIRQVRSSILLAYLPSVEKVPSIVSAVDAVFLVVVKQGGSVCAI